MCLSCWFRQLEDFSKVMRVCKISKVIGCLCLLIFLLFAWILLVPFRTSLRIGFPGIRLVGVVKPFRLCQTLIADMYTLIVVGVTDRLKYTAKYATVSLSAGKAQTLCRLQNCLNRWIPALYVALVEGAKACLITSFRLRVGAFLELQVWVLGWGLPVGREKRSV